MIIRIIKILIPSVLLLLSSSIHAEPFKISDIVIEGLERIEAGEKPEAIEKPVFEHLEEFRRLSQTININTTLHQVTPT